MSNPVARRDKHVKLQQIFIAVRMIITDEQGSRACLMNFPILSHGLSLNTSTTEYKHTEEERSVLPTEVLKM
jgi:hypothetical protein